MAVLSACSGSKRKKVQDLTTEELLDAFSNESDDRIRAAAVRQLGKRNDHVAVVALIIALKDHAEQVRIAAASVLGEQGNRDAIDPLSAVAADPTVGSKTRLAAALSLVRLGDQRGAEALVNALPNHDAAAALRTFSNHGIPALVQGLHAPETRDNAIQVLISCGQQAVDPLVEVARSDKDKYARLAAIKVLSESEDERAQTVIEDALRDTRPEFTLAAYRYLIRGGKPSSESRLVETLMAAGSREMAQDFLSCGNPVLKRAAEAWAAKRSDPLIVRTSPLNPVFWGGEDPSIRQLALFHFDDSISSTAGLAPQEARGVTFVPGKWGKALSVGKGGILRYPVDRNLRFDDGSIEMWISPKLDGSDEAFNKYNHSLLLYDSHPGDQFLVSSSTLGGFYCGSVVQRKFAGAGGGSIRTWKAGSWHHIAFTYSSRNTRQRLYIDGAMVSEIVGAMPPPHAGSPTFTIGSDPYGNWTAFNVDELLLSNAEKGPDWIQRDAARKNPL